jgi:hypothetical protein
MMTPDDKALYMTLHVFDLAALTCIGEAEDQGQAGQVAVLSVIKNRHDLWKQTYQTVCLGAGQFECFDKEGLKLVQIARGMLGTGDPFVMTPTQTQIVGLAETVLTGETASNVGLSTFYKRFDAPSPWFEKEIAAGKFVEHSRIGEHVFYEETRFKET